jgi:hypothetical protein
MYSILEAGGTNIRKAKGVSKTVVKKDLHHELYKDCLEKRKKFHHIQTAIRSDGHQIGLYEQNKVSLSPLDTKKWIADDGITTRAYGHYLKDASREWNKFSTRFQQWKSISTRFVGDRANSMRRKFSLKRDNQKLFANEAPRRRGCCPLMTKGAQHIGGALIEIVESGLTGLAENIIDGVDGQRPHGVSSSTPAALQLARLVQISNHIRPIKSRFLEADHAASRGGGLARDRRRFYRVGWFLPVSRVGSSFRAATTAGKARTHSRERSDEPRAASRSSCAY